MVKDWYKGGDKVYVAVDCIIFGFDNGILKLLVFKRRVAPFEGRWSLIGSFVRPNESSSEASQRVLKEITGLDNIYMRELRAYSEVDRDPGARCISIGQYALIRIDEHDKELVESYGAKWYPLDELPSLVLDHERMVADALNRLRTNAQFYPIGFELLPQKFTIPQLQHLYEVIFQKEFDSRNFRKKLLSLGILKKLDEKDKSSSKKGAFLFQFDSNKYKRIRKKGFSIPLFKNQDVL
ncbi:NUDIX hydrolase [Flagellimonas sp.]|uniref:NUDIX hydrolase n=1 Tax=Flagellimonas sp. TaxID=2058762 RepID=UPI003B5CF946